MDKAYLNDKKDNLTSGSFKLCVITYPFSKTTHAYSLLFDHIEIFKQICEKLYVITGNIPEDELIKIREPKINFINFKVDRDFNKRIAKPIALILWIFNVIISQIEIARNLFYTRNHFDAVIFYLGPYFYQLPLLLARLLKKRVVMVAAISNTTSAEIEYGKFISFMNKILDKFNYAISDCIIADAENIQSLDLHCYKNKIAYRPRYVDLNIFKIDKEFGERRNLIGYIGRFSKAKGIMNFIEAIPQILKENKDVEILIGGGGVLLPEVNNKIRSYQTNKVVLIEWIPHIELPKYLNELKLIIVPSYLETGPFIALEAMACGTPVLATKVGLIPSTIKDRETGFFLKNNSSICIAESVTEALKNPNLHDIAKNSRSIIEKKFAYIDAVNRYRYILYDE